MNCGRRFGKDILCIDLILWPALEGKEVAWFQPSYKSLLEVWRCLKRVLRPVTVASSEQDKRIELVSGGIIDFWSLDGDPEACRGRKYKRVVINEAAKARYLEVAWTMAIRPTLTDYQGDAIFPSTPRGRDYYWQLFQRGVKGSDTYDPSWRSWQKPTIENTKIPGLAEEIEAAKRDMPTDIFNQEYMATFLDVGGRFFDEWEPERRFTDFDEASGEFCERVEDWHTCVPFVVPTHWEKWASVDYGTTPTLRTFAVVLFTMDEHGAIYAIDEIYEAGLESPEQVDAVLAMLERNHLASPVDPLKRSASVGKWHVSPRLTSMPMDPGFGYTSTFPPEPTGHSLAKIAERQGKYPSQYYLAAGLPVRRATTDRVAGWREVKTLMHGCRIVKDESGEETAVPLIRVFRGCCSNLIRTIPLMVRSQIRPEDIEGADLEGGEKKQEDHLPTALRLGVMTRKHPAVKPKQPAESAPPPPGQPDLRPEWLKRGPKKRRQL